MQTGWTFVDGHWNYFASSGAMKTGWVKDQETWYYLDKDGIMLSLIHIFCKEHDLLCYLCGGGAIGALRNKGFIPWDDDLDFFMPRKDYEKLAELWPRYADERYFLSKSNKDFVDRNLFITIRDKETTCIKPYQKDLDLPHGLALDVLPLDYYPKNPAERKKQVRWALIYSCLLYTSRCV